MLLTGMHMTPTMLLHYLVKHILKTSNITQSQVVTSSVMGIFKEIPLLESLLITYQLTINCSMHLFVMTYDDVINKRVYLQRQSDNVDQLKLALEAEWNRLSQTFINKSINE